MSVPLTLLRLLEYDVFVIAGHEVSKRLRFKYCRLNEGGESFGVMYGSPGGSGFT